MVKHLYLRAHTNGVIGMGHLLLGTTLSHDQRDFVLTLISSGEALLTILNEKIYRNGDQDLRVNIRGIITASNELPPRNASLDPIWDRFLLRLELGNIRKFQNFVNMIVDTDDVYQVELPAEVQFSEAELVQFDAAINGVEVPAEVLNTIQVLKLRIDEHNARPNNQDQQIPIHDRRWKKIVRLLRTSAFLNGRNRVDLMDCFLMIHCLWSRPEQKELIEEMVTDAIRRHGYSMAVNLNLLKREVEDFEKDVNEEIRVKHTVAEEQLLVVQEDYYELIKEDQQFEGFLVSVKQFRHCRARVRLLPRARPQMHQRVRLL
jgi:MoxR-like ATPase